MLDRVVEVRVRASAVSAEEVTAYAYDADGNLTSIVDPLGETTTMTYDAVGRLTTRTLPNGVVSTWTYDLRDRIATLTHRAPGGEVLASEAYVRSASGEPTRVTREDGSYVEYGYDAALRLTSERHHTPSGALAQEITYGYDVDGNRTSRNAETYTYGPGFRLASAGAESFGYDGAGRVTSLGRDGGVALAYDSDDHVTSVTRSGGTTSYAFGGSGRRVRVSSAGTERRFLVAPSLARGYESPHLVTDGVGATLASYVYAGEHALARYEAGGPTYYLRDAMGSVIALADESGARVARLDYDAFGNVRGSAGSASGLPVETAGDFRYHGMWMDPTGLYYVRARSYDPVTGRFVSQDPAEQAPLLPEESHPYAFNANVPTVKRDPEGRFSLAELSFAQTVQKVLSTAQTAAKNQARNHLKNQVSQVPGDLAAAALRQIVPAGSITGMHGLGRGSTGFDLGEVFEQVMQNTVCLFLNQFDSGAFDYLYWEVPVSQVDGKPSGDGFICGQAQPRSASSGRARRGSLFPRNGGTRGRSFMDFVVSSFAPRLLDSSISGGLQGKRAFLGGYIKLSMGAIGRGSQFKSFIKFAKDYSYHPIFVFLLLRGGTQAERAAIIRSALPIFPEIISVL